MRALFTQHLGTPAAPQIPDPAHLSAPRHRASWSSPQDLQIGLALPMTDPRAVCAPTAAPSASSRLLPSGGTAVTPPPARPPLAGGRQRRCAGARRGGGSAVVAAPRMRTAGGAEAARGQVRGGAAREWRGAAAGLGGGPRGAGGDGGPRGGSQEGRRKKCAGSSRDGSRGSGVELGRGRAGR